MQQKRTLLAVFAHPDDESLFVGGTLALYAAAGMKVHLLCATRGEVGQISDPSLATPDTLGEVREQELRAACRELGIEQPVFLGYRDSGMEGSPNNQSPACFIRAGPAAVVRRLVEEFQRLRPQAVVTFDANGGYGHPDHIAAHRHATQAFQAAGLRTTSARLYYGALPRSLLRRLVALDLPSSPFRREDAERMGTPDEEVAAQIDVSSVLDRKMRAIVCHRTQMQPQGPFWGLPQAEVTRLLATEFFQRAWPPRPPGEAREAGLLPE